LLLALDLAGTFAFALNGALTAVRAERLDIFGVITLGMFTALGGGTIRDVLLGALPPATFVDWRYLAVAASGGLIAFALSRRLDRLTLPITVLDAIGLSVFSVLAAYKALDLGFGVPQAIIVGAVTAVGGGTIRDVLLGHYPLAWVLHPTLLLLAAGAALATIVFARLVHRLTTAFLVLDAIGLVVFTMAGCDVAWQVDPSFQLVVVIVSGMITGCAGGVLRDILCNDVPLLFRTELYASVSVITGLFYATAFGLTLNGEVRTGLTFVLGLTLRLLAIRYKWEMPKFVFNNEQR